MDFDIIVIGGGHSGVEAATVAARMQKKVCLLTMKKDDIGQLSCNPAIGGIGKGHLVREIDVFGGLIAELADKGCIHYKMLNSTKGEAVQGGRAQIDRDLYKKASQEIVLNYPNLTVLFDEAIDIIESDKQNTKEILKANSNTNINHTPNNAPNNTKYLTLITKNKKFKAKKIIITTGTFLGGKLFLGDKIIAGGRLNNQASNPLAQTITKSHKTFRLKTGTPPRIYRDTINYNVLEKQIEDDITIPFSLNTKQITNPQIACHITYTNETTHNLIHKYLAANKNYNAAEDTVNGPRYCPSIEIKLLRFPHRKRHRIFLEPEGLNSNIVYPNGISNSFSLPIQQEMINTIPGLEKTVIESTGYAVEYMCIDTQDIKNTLESKHIKGLFFAGQINGTTGYEEAAAQGLIAGINAALQTNYNNNNNNGNKNKNNKNNEEYPEQKFILPRESSYIGVLIDDLINKTKNKVLSLEPYRIFSSRVENRLNVRFDNALSRLAPYAENLNLLTAKRKKLYEENKQNLSVLYKQTKAIKIRVNDSVAKTFYDLLSMPQFQIENIECLLQNLDLTNISYITWCEFIANAKYAGYQNRHNYDLKLLAHNEKDKHIKIPKDFEWKKMHSLSHEVITILKHYQPTNIRQLKLIPNLSPSAIIHILNYFNI